MLPPELTLVSFTKKIEGGLEFTDSVYGDGRYEFGTRVLANATHEEIVYHLQNMLQRTVKYGGLCPTLRYAVSFMDDAITQKQFVSAAEELGIRTSTAGIQYRQSRREDAELEEFMAA